MPDASWILARSMWAGGVMPTVLAVKSTAFPSSDSLDRTNYSSVPIGVPAPPAGLSITNAVVEFGYEENGPPASYYCMSRQETCVAGTAGAIPFKWKSEAVTGVSCTSGCTVLVPGISGHAMYYRIVWRDSGNSPKSVGPQKVTLVP